MKKGGDARIELATSCTLSKNHTTRPITQFTNLRAEKLSLSLLSLSLSLSLSLFLSPPPPPPPEISSGFFVEEFRVV